MRDLLNYELSTLREKLRQANERGDKDEASAIATRILQLQSNLSRINRMNWYRR